jgi:Ca2+-binding RTX toxin-like protein
VIIDLRPGEWTRTSSVQLANLGDGHFARGNVSNALLFSGDPRSLIENGIGGSGNDSLFANQATNRLTGNGGIDTFIWSSPTYAGVGSLADVIADFQAGLDKINLVDIDARSTTSGNDDFSFIGTAAFSGSAGQLRYQVEGSSTRVQADTNGDAIADFEILLSNVTLLSSTDFFL